MTQEQTPQIPVTDADFAELFRRMPQARMELDRIVMERTQKEQMLSRINELEAQASNGVGEGIEEMIEV
jgi:tetrahydromethanopterin S-methyltransferase subunit G